MKHECGLCLRDNNFCHLGKSFWQLLKGNVKDCVLYDDYHNGLIKVKKSKHKEALDKMKKKGLVHV